MTAIAVCPGCVTAPMAQTIAMSDGGTVLSLPGIHCAGCIGTVEKTLMGIPGVRAARVNLSRKRVTVDAPSVADDVLVEQLSLAGYDALPLDADMMASVETDAVGRGLLLRLAVAGFAMMNVMLFSVAVWSGAPETTRTMFHWISAAIAVPTLAYSAEVFFRQAWTALRVYRLNMDVPISLAIILAAGLSVYETAIGSGHVYFDAALSLTFFLLVGRYLDHRTRIAARSAAQELSALIEPSVTLLKDGKSEAISTKALQVGDRILVLAGMRLPIDGTVVAGHSQMDRSVLTGESLPIAVSAGDHVSAGEINLNGRIEVMATATGQDTSLAQIASMVETAEGARNTYTALADVAAKIYAPAVHLTALVTFLGWIIASGDPARSLNIAISVLIITCPCALGLAVPAVMTAATGRLFRHGLLVKNGTALERMAGIDTVVFDKTGTLTQGHAAIDTAGFDSTEIGVLAALARASDHPVSRAIAAAIPEDVASADVTDIIEQAGVGVSGRLGAQTVSLGRSDQNTTVLTIGQRAPKPVPMRETLREGAQQAVTFLQEQGLRTFIYSGDHAEAVAKVGKSLGIENYQSDMRPTDKQTALQDLAQSGAKVLMIGDGLNDTLALAQAHVSISPASALDASRAASDIVLLRQSLGELAEVVTTAKSAKARIIENFLIAAGYNAIAIPIAVLGFATPLGAAIAMSASSITVLLNALRVR